VLRLEAFGAQRLSELAAAIVPDTWPELAQRGVRLVALAEATCRKVLPTLKSANQLDVVLQPCIRDVWHAHVLFVGDEVGGIVDFGSMRPDNVATDVARLLGSLAGDNAENWQRGLAAYQLIRPLSDDEVTLVTAFDRSTVVLGGLQWLEWIYLEGRRFDNRPAVLERVDEFLGRLERLAQAVS
jgi:Ser/Thr protein kinase RdoA (MazF antagonist)